MTAQALAQQDPQVVASILAAAVDVTIIMTPDGVICDGIQTGPDMPKAVFSSWPGKSLGDIVTIESRPKIAQLLDDATRDIPARWRQVNHPVRGGQDLAVSYSAIKAGPAGHIIAMGRDMSSVAQLQQRLMSAEQATEAEYQRLRNSETRFRMLLQSASDAIMIAELRSGRVVESNALAGVLLGKTAKRMQNAEMLDLFAEVDRGGVKAAIEAIRNAGRTDDIVLHPTENHQQVHVSMSMFRQESTQYLLVRMVPHVVGNAAIVVPKTQSKVVKIISEMPDGFVMTDPHLNILSANAAFLEQVQLASEEQARGISLERWLGRAGVDMGIIANQLEEKGEIRNFSTIIRGQFGAIEDVEVSAVSVAEGDTPCFGFSLRPVSRQRANGHKPDNGMLRSVDEFTRLVGKVPLKELVRESTDIIERLCIEAALQMNGDNRANAAEMLGLSRQSLYMKLHRYGIDDIDSSD